MKALETKVHEIVDIQESASAKNQCRGSNEVIETTSNINKHTKKQETYFINRAKQIKHLRTDFSAEQRAKNILFGIQEKIVNNV